MTDLSEGQSEPYIDEVKSFFEAQQYIMFPHIVLPREALAESLSFLKNNLENALIKISIESDLSTYVLVNHHPDDKINTMLMITALEQLLGDLNTISGTSTLSLDHIRNLISKHISKLREENFYTFYDVLELYEYIWYPLYDAFYNEK